MTVAPNFMRPENERYMTLTLGKWSISDDAPQELKNEFNTWQEQYHEAEARGILL